MAMVALTSTKSNGHLWRLSRRVWVMAIPWGRPMCLSLSTGVSNAILTPLSGVTHRPFSGLCHRASLLRHTVDTGHLARTGTQ